MGNRGRLHNAHGYIVRQWHTKAWITWQLEFKGRHRDSMSPNSYTEPFFLDEATAFSAGHRPCGECRRQDFQRFKELWMASNPKLANGESIKSLDAVLHRERVSGDRKKRLYDDYLKNLPNGTMFMLPGKLDQYFALYTGELFKWAPSGYKSCKPIGAETLVHVLTPQSIVNTFCSGYAIRIFEERLL